MTAIYKRELKAYFSSPLGYIVVAFFMFSVGLIFCIYNLVNQYPWFGVGLYSGIKLYSIRINMSFILFLIIPIITMRIMSEDRKQKIDQLLYTAPVKIIEIVLGKYLSVISIYAIPMLIFCLYPILLLSFGKNPNSLSMDYVVILGYFLLGAAWLAIGFFASTITESQVLAAVLTFAILLMSNFSSGLASLIPATSAASLIALSILIIILGFIVYFMTKSIFMALLSSLVVEAIILVLFLIDASVFSGLINKILYILDMSAQMDNLVYGALDLTVIAYYLSVIVLFIFLSVQAIYKRRWS